MDITCGACGYRYFRENSELEIGDKSFIEFKAYGSIGRRFKQTNMDTEVVVYACPECGTLKLNI